MTQDELQSLCSEWQKTLRLQDWDIRARFVKHYRFPQSKQGEVSCVEEQKTALIRILVPEDYEPDQEWPQDIEQTLVHELVHVHFIAFTDSEKGSAKDLALEQGVELTAWALVNLKRNANR